MNKPELIVKCELCGHIIELLNSNHLDDLTCDCCGYDKFSVISDNSKIDEPIPDDNRLEISEEPKDCILYLITQSGETMVITKKSKFSYHSINRITPDMRLYTYNGALSARDALLKKHPSWRLKVKQFN